MNTSRRVPELGVTVLNRQRGRRIGTRGLASFLRRAHRFTAPSAPQSLAVCLVSAARMRKLNRTYRGVDQPTDVLSFPCGPSIGPNDPDDEGEHLGDIVISVPNAERQAREARHSLARELRILSLHGLLHLLGHDHERDDGTMMRLERKMLRSLLGPSGDRG